MYSLVVLLLFSVAPLAAEDASVPLSFQRLLGLEDLYTKEAAIKHLQRELRPFLHKQVVIQGFLYKDSTDQWILSPEPHLKTCCLRQPAKLSQQLILKGDFSGYSLGKVYNLTGVLQLVPLWDDQEQLQQLYSLENASISKSSAFAWLTPSFMLTMISLGGMIIAFSFAWKLLYAISVVPSDEEARKSP